MRYSRIQLIVFVTIVFSHLGLISCQFVRSDFEREKSEVLEFRRLVRERAFAQVYLNTSNAFKSAIDEKSFIENLTPVAEDISDPSNFELILTSTNLNLMNTPLTVLEYERKGNGSVAFDEFVFIEEDGKCRLANYRYELK